MMNTQRFDFGRLVDGLTIEIHINENHRQALRLQMIERFDMRQGQRRLHPTVKMAAVMAIGFGLVGIGLVVHQSTTTPPAPGADVNNALDRMDLAAARGDLSMVTEFLHVRSLPVQRAAIRHLAILGNTNTVEELEDFLQVDREPEIQSAAEQAIERIRQRLSIPMSPPPVDVPPVNSPPAMRGDTAEASLHQPSAVEGMTDFRFWVVDDESSQPLDQVYVLTVSRGIELSGQVLDHRGDPILGATVAEGYDLRKDNGTAWQTDVQGHFSLRRLQAGRKILTVSAPGYAPEMTVIDLESDLHEVTFSLQPGNSLRFEVVDSEGHPLRGVSVETRAWRTFSPLRRAFNLKRQTKTNAKGAATLTDLPADDVIFRLTKKGYAECHHLQACPADRKIAVVLHRSGEVFASTSTSTLFGFSN